MRRQRNCKPGISVSLFPFLAVLVCTMGVLIVLLVLVVQQARVDAAVKSEPPPDKDQEAALEELRLAQQDAEWRREILDEQRAKMTDQLADRRLQLSHLEDHIRRLEEKWKQLQAQVEELQSISLANDQDQQAATTELERVRQQLASAQRQLDDARKSADQRPRSFAIIPYAGPNGTQRRPMFVECTRNGIILQPEGIVLTAEDLYGPLGPGNPLDAALRATREYLTRQGATPTGEPYPLLIVRPDGALAYSAARAAMSSWDDEFGYELIDAEMQLEYPAADPALTDLLARTVRDARQRQQILAAAMPSEYRGAPEGGFVATPARGGFVPVAGSPGSGGHGGHHGTRPPGSPPAGSGAAGESAEGHDQPTAPNGEPQQAGGRPAGANTPGGNAAGGSNAPCIADSRGGNWALPKASANATGITRPIRVVCWPDRLIIMPDEGDPREPVVVLANGELRAVIDEFVSAIWQHTERWGLAVAGGYWKPVLNAEVAPGADFRLEELQRLMEGSGMEVKRKKW